MKKEYTKPEIEVVDFQSEEVMSDGEGSVVSGFEPGVDEDF